MKNLDYREYYRRNLPHIQPRGATFLVNFRLAGSLPTEIVEELRADADRIDKERLQIRDPDEKRLWEEKKHQKLLELWDDALHQNRSGPFYLGDERIAGIVANSIRYHDGEWFDVEAYCIMPNHVRLVITPFQKTETADYGLSRIMHNIKRNSAKQANAILGQTGGFWQHESYDHFVRDVADIERMIQYVLQNPVKAGLVTDWSKWKWVYCKYEM